MRHSTIISFLSLSLLFCIGCKQETSQNTDKEVVGNEVVLTPLIKYSVTVEDTSFNYMLRKDSLWTKFEETKDSIYLKKALVTNIIYLPFREFESFKSSLYAVIQNDKLFITDKNLEIPADQSSRRRLYKLCDSIMFTDEPKRPPIFQCDSVSALYMISSLDFYEKWSYAAATGSITKEILAYSPMRFNDMLQKFVPVFYIFKNKEVYEEIKSKILNPKK